jgi:DNA-binding transcriptional regulator YhcF (GntR family)
MSSESTCPVFIFRNGLTCSGPNGETILTSDYPLFIEDKNGKKREILFKPVSPKRNSEDIALQIENLIISRIYKSNDRLPPERELAIQFNAGRPAVREALRLLDGSGYIRVKPGGDGGIFVKELDSSRITKTILDFIKSGNINSKE